MNYFLRLAHFLALVFAIFALGCLLNIAVMIASLALIAG